MPHVTLEYSANLPELASYTPLFSEIHTALHEIAGINLGNCKSRARKAEPFHIADGNAAHAFIHLNIEFVEGRSAQVKQALGSECLALLKRHYQARLNDQLQITVNIIDIKLDNYFKFPEGSLTKQ